MPRHPIGDRAMTDAERQRKRRERLREEHPVLTDRQKLLAALAEIKRLRQRVQEMETTGRLPKASPEEIAVLQAALASERAARVAEIAALKAELARKSADADPTRIAELEEELASSREATSRAHNAIAAAEDFFNRKGRMFPYAVYQTLKHATHPDLAGPQWKVRYHTAHLSLQEHERALAEPKPKLRPGRIGWPSTPEEWAAMKHAARKNRMAKRKGKAKRAATPSPLLSR